MEAIIGIVWIVIFIAIISKALKSSANKQNQRPRMPAQNAAPQPIAPQRSASAPERIRRLNNYGNNSYDTAAMPAGKSRKYDGLGQRKLSNFKENDVLLEDRKNDWLAKQLREEAAILRRGDTMDLGAAHEKECDARKLKFQHILRHNTNGLDRQTFR